MQKRPLENVKSLQVVQLREHRVNLLDLLFVAQTTYRVLDLERLVDASGI